MTSHLFNFNGISPRSGHFRLESNHHSDTWLDLETLCARPAAIATAAEELARRLDRFRPDAVCGPLNEGAFVALLVALRLKCEFFYAERFEDPRSSELFPVRYRLPGNLREFARGKRVAIVNDVTSAGSAVRGTFVDLLACGARVIAIGTLLLLGDSMDEFARSHDVVVEALARAAFNRWRPDECPLCRVGVPIDPTNSQ